MRRTPRTPESRKDSSRSISTSKLVRRIEIAESTSRASAGTGIRWARSMIVRHGVVIPSVRTMPSPSSSGGTGSLPQSGIWQVVRSMASSCRAEWTVICPPMPLLVRSHENSTIPLRSNPWKTNRRAAVAPLVTARPSRKSAPATTWFNHEAGTPADRKTPGATESKRRRSRSPSICFGVNPRSANCLAVASPPCASDRR
uniref:Unannotated protein n=1 Tax=freshwater metagenome TaxID=449393 RepID=A0A6J7P9M4_9ZZZZ